ncbi:30S ribosomal protein S20 [Candidatus Nomurabacteria bacterium]|nr:30S ribosomal protein S20 [Candidatus Nomurabacteria bacterium]
MPITKSAKKALRGSKKKRVFNMRRKNKMNDVVKDIRKFAVAKNKSEAQKLLSSAYKAIDKAAKMGTISKNTAGRKKSRLAKLIKKI